MKKLTVLIALTGLLAACGPTGPAEELVVSGAVTYNGGLAVLAGQATLSTSRGNVASSDVHDGTYTLRADIAPSSCSSTSLTVIGRSASGTLLEPSLTFLGSCGQHRVDIAF